MITKNNYSEKYYNSELKEALLKKCIVIKNNKINGKSFIHIALSIDNSYIYPALVSMTSIMENCNKNKTIVSFYILFEGKVNETNLYKLESIVTNYKENVELYLYNMSNAFYSLKWYQSRTPLFYRLLLPNLLDFLDRVIHIDSDVLAFDDLYEMYTLPFKNNFILASRDTIQRGDDIDIFGINRDKYICAGIILYNLKKIRKQNKLKLAVQFLKTKTKYISYYDQTVINFIFYPYIGKLPYKFAIINYENEKNMREMYAPYNKSREDRLELISALKKPSLVHYVLCLPKFWYNNSIRFMINQPCEDTKIWYNYANKTNYYREIYNEYMK